MTDTFKDPVCDMDVTPETAAGTSEYQTKTEFPRSDIDLGNYFFATSNLGTNPPAPRDARTSTRLLDNVS
jgi:YHS domain-containing protein